MKDRAMQVAIVLAVMMIVGSWFAVDAILAFIAPSANLAPAY